LRSFYLEVISIVVYVIKSINLIKQILQEELEEIKKRIEKLRPAGKNKLYVNVYVFLQWVTK
jgi:heme exporter protein D